MPTLIALLAALEGLPDDATLYATRPCSASSGNGERMPTAPAVDETIDARDD